jgi:rSAM/selenodomain-associated transferase 1
MFFVKYPDAGKVKTRLAEEIGSNHAAELYKCFVHEILLKLRTIKIPFTICIYPPEQQEQMMQWLGQDNVYVPQNGTDLGEKMKNAFMKAFENKSRQVVLIGSDFPDLPVDYLTDALIELDSNDTVIGPSSDGGYYLIGFNRTGFLPEVFKGINWGGAEVFEKTVNILKQHEQHFSSLPQWYDIDTVEDLKLLIERSKDSSFKESETFAYLMSNRLWSESNV